MNLPKILGTGASAPLYVAASVYGCLLLVLMAATALPLKGVLDQRAAVESLGDMLRRLEGRGPATAQADAAGDHTATESAFLEGSTVTIAGAALLQRVVGTVTRHGGNVSSSQLELQGNQAKDGFISVTASLDLEQPALQEIIYDLEAGMPFLFIDQLVVEGPGPSTTTTGEKLNVVISVSGQWRGPQ
jgi:general secretion pathway protein M